MTMEKIILGTDLRVKADKMTTWGVAEASFAARMTLEQVQRFFENMGFKVTEEQWKEIKQYRRTLRNGKPKCMNN